MSKYFTSADEKSLSIYDAEGYTKEIEELNRDDSNLSVTITLKNGTAIKNEITRNWMLSRRIFILSKNGLIVNYKEYGVNKQKSTIS